MFRKNYNQISESPIPFINADMLLNIDRSSVKLDKDVRYNVSEIATFNAGLALTLI